MRLLERFFLIGLLFATPLAGLAKSAHKEAAKLDYECKKLGEGAFEIVFKLNLPKGLYVKANSDYDSTVLDLPKFSFDKNNKYTIVGEAESKGLIETRKIRRAGIVNMYTYTVLYSQRVNAEAGTVVTGTFTYRPCNDHAARRRKTEKFSVTLK